MCPNRVLVQAPVAEQFTSLVRDAMQETLKMGNGLAAGVTQGPLINAPAVAKVERHVADAVAKGGEVLLGGKRVEGGVKEGGRGKDSLFFEPTLISGATADMACFQEETFGPVCAVTTFESEAEAVALANAVPAGLAAYLFSDSLARCWRVTEALEYGMVGVNDAAISDPAAPFGGVKQSGFGREGSRYGLQEYMELKYMCLGGLARE